MFRNQAGNHVDASAYGITWARARKHVLTRTELASGLAKRPYDLRHAGISFWLHSGVDPAECARRAGQSIEVLFRAAHRAFDIVVKGAACAKRPLKGCGEPRREPGALCARSPYGV
ncbi:hypothetical protein [Streptomyces huasconensis]|uniref:hypothetical protein n=1 Tax=Streptomyces huasconensis TaxID=1854574 RepID=UPI0033D9B6DA